MQNIFEEKETLEYYISAFRALQGCAATDWEALKQRNDEERHS
jgi:hypothetical protein